MKRAYFTDIHPRLFGLSGVIARTAKFNCYLEINLWLVKAEFYQNPEVSFISKTLVINTEDAKRIFEIIKAFPEQ